MTIARRESEVIYAIKFCPKHCGIFALKAMQYCLALVRTKTMLKRCDIWNLYESSGKFHTKLWVTKTKRLFQK